MKISTITSAVLVGGLLIPTLSSGHNANSGHQYRATQGVNNVKHWANSLRGQSFNTPAFNAYCDQYATVAVRQAQVRISRHCESHIRFHSANLASRWGQGKWNHKQWCLSVSSNASGREANIRENQLRNCPTFKPVDTKETIRRDCITNDKMHLKARQGDRNFVLKCLNAGVSANHRERNNWTPLHTAGRYGRQAIAALLLSRGAAVNARDVYGRTPLDQANFGKYTSVANYLRNHGGVGRDQ